MIRVSLAILAVSSSKDYYVRLKYNLVLAAVGCYPVQTAWSGVQYPWKWFWVLQLVRFSRISTSDSRNLLVNGCSFLNMSQIFEYCNWGILRTQGIILHFSQSLGFFSLHLLSSVEAKMFEDRRWAKDGSQLPGTWYQKTSFHEVSYLWILMCYI